MMCTRFHVTPSPHRTYGPETSTAFIFTASLHLQHLLPSPHYRPLKYAGSPAQPESRVILQSSSNSGASQRPSLSSIGKQ